MKVSKNQHSVQIDVLKPISLGKWYENFNTTTVNSFTENFKIITENKPWYDCHQKILLQNLKEFPQKYLVKLDKYMLDKPGRSKCGFLNLTVFEPIHYILPPLCMGVSSKITVNTNAITPLYLVPDFPYIHVFYYHA